MSITIRQRTRRTSGRAALYLDIYEDGKRSCESLGLFVHLRPHTASEREDNRQAQDLARSIAAKKELEHAARRNGLPSPNARLVALADLIQSYKSTPRTNTHPSRDWNGRDKVLSHLADYTHGKAVLLADVDAGFLEGFKHHLIGKGLKLATVRIYLNNILAPLRAFARRHPGAPPVPQVPTLRVPESETRYLTAEDLQKLVATPCKFPDISRAFLFACFTGRRFGEVRALKWEDIDLSNRSYRFYQRKTGTYETNYLNSEALAVLGGAGDLSAAVFPIPENDAVNTQLRRWGREAGVSRRISFHVSRHTAATLLHSSGTDLYTVMRALGHSSIQTTMRYAKVIDPVKREAMDKMPKLITGNVLKLVSNR